MKSTFSVIKSVLFAVTIVSCATFEMTTTSLKQRFAEIDSTDLKTVIVRGPFGEQYTYLTHPSSSIELKDKNGKALIMPLKPSIEMRVTYDGGRKTVFYLDKIFVSDSLLIGHNSWFINSISTKIPLNKIEKIEVQDGKKNFKYLDH